MPPTPFWPTPTPIPISAATPVFDFGANIPRTLAEDLVQGWQQANNLGALDILIFAIILFIILGGLWSIIRRLQTM